MRLAPGAWRSGIRPLPMQGPYETLFGCPVSFGADANRLLIGRAEADHPLPTGNRDLAAAHDRILVEQLARLDKANVVARFRASLLERMTSGEFSEEDIARDLHMSRRSLQRRLAEADASYQSLVDDTRRDMALRYIQDPAKSATDITFLLGYSQQSVFTRAFRQVDGHESVGIPLQQVLGERLARTRPRLCRRPPGRTPHVLNQPDWRVL